MKDLTDEDDLSTYKYMEGFLYKKEDDKNWVEYYAQIRGRYFLFYKHKTSLENLREAFKGCIELTDNTKCIVAKRKKYNFPFYVSTDRSKYLFKVVSSVKRHEWFKAIEMASQGKPMPSLNLPADTSNSPTETSLSDDDKSSGDEKDMVLPTAHINNSFALSEEDLSTKHEVLMSTQAQIQTSRFFDRTDNNKPTTVDERLHQIYCAEDTDNNQSRNESSKSKFAIPTFLYSKPEEYKLPPSRTVKSYDRRYFTSAECLSDRKSILNISINNEKNLFQTSKSCKNNVSPTHNVYSRHLVRSAPNVKTSY